MNYDFLLIITKKIDIFFLLMYTLLKLKITKLITLNLYTKLNITCLLDNLFDKLVLFQSNDNKNRI